MPRANRDLDTVPVRYPRTIFEHAHQDGVATFPPAIGGGSSAEAFMLMPDNWNGLDSLVLFLLGGWTGQLANLTVTINIATCNEAFNVHTQTVANIVVDTVLNEYECVDLTALFAVVLANLVSRDMIWIVATLIDEQNLYVVGLEAQET